MMCGDEERTFSAAAILSVVFDVLLPPDGTLREGLELCEFLAAEAEYGLRLSSLMECFGSDFVVTRLSAQLPRLSKIEPYHWFVPRSIPKPPLSTWMNEAMAVLGSPCFTVRRPGRSC